MTPEAIVEKLQNQGKSPILWRTGSSWLIYCADYISGSLYSDLECGIDWRQDVIKIFGRSIPLPRLTAWYGDSGATYAYSGIINQPKPWIGPLAELRRRLENDFSASFNSVLANRYADGQQHQGYHADDERELGAQPLIASLSLGATRRFLVKSRNKDSAEATLKLELEAGSLLLMGGDLQRDYVHAIAKTTKALGPRINLTFRLIRSD